VILEAVVFDFDGLILDTEVPEFVTVREEFENHGLELLLEDWQQIIGRADHPHWLDWLERDLGRPVDREVVRARRLEKHHALIAANDVLPGVEALLDQADELGVAAAVASSSTSSWVEGHLDRLGLLGRFAAVRTRDHVEHAKPWPDVFLAAVEALGVLPAHAVAFEDSFNGCAAAKAAGLACVVVPNEITRGLLFDAADLVTDSLADVDLTVLAAHL
jgi:HAD superfamily hydrolase (TIGR01509 family)